MKYKVFYTLGTEKRFECVAIPLESTIFEILQNQRFIKCVSGMFIRTEFIHSFYALEE